MLAFARRKYAEIEYGYPMVLTPGVASARFPQRCKYIFRRDVPDQIVSRKGAAAKPRQRPVEPAAACFVRRKNFFLRILGPAVQMHS